MRRRHPPVITAAGSFISFGESAPYHDSISAAGECLTNVAAFAHAAIGNDWNKSRRSFEVGIARGRAIHGGSDLRYPQPKDAARGTGRPRTDADKNSGRPAAHDFESNVVSDRVADNDRDPHFTAEFLKI